MGVFCGTGVVSMGALHRLIDGVIWFDRQYYATPQGTEIPDFAEMGI